MLSASNRTTGFFYFGSIAMFVKFFINGIYEFYFLTTTGQTFGKKALGLTVLSTQGTIIRFDGAIKRIIIGVIPLEFIACFFTSKKQCLHDIFADTVVVDKPESI